MDKTENKRRQRMTEDKQFGLERLTPPESVDYFTYRLETGRAHKNGKRWMIAFFVVLAIAFFTNVWWVWRETQFEDVKIVSEASTDGGGDAFASGAANGDVNYYGESQNNDNN